MRYVAGFLIAIGLIVLIFVIIFKVFTGGGNPEQQQQIKLGSYANTDTTVQLLIIGPVVANKNHREVQINVGENQTEVNVFKGYQHTLIKTKSYDNNVSAYAVFLRALSFGNFTKGIDNSDIADYRGHCPAGDIYVYQIINGNSHRIQQYWKSTCGNGTFEGNSGAINNLFKKQVPDYGKVTSGVNL
jgi:hypothetical protein